MVFPTLLSTHKPLTRKWSLFYPQNPFPLVHFFLNWSLSSFSSVQLLSRGRLFATPWIAALQASLFITNSQSPPKPMSIELVMLSNHLSLCHPLLLLVSLFLLNFQIAMNLFLETWLTATQTLYPLGLTLYNLKSITDCLALQWSVYYSRETFIVSWAGLFSVMHVCDEEACAILDVVLVITLSTTWELGQADGLVHWPAN